MKTRGLSLDQAPPEDISFRFFLTAPLFGAIAGGLVLLQGSELFLTTWYGKTIALTHLITLGWLAMIMLGAFYQMMPVLIGGGIPFLSLSRFVHAGVFLGVLGLTGGIWEGYQIGFVVASAVLTVCFSVFIVQMAIPLFKVKTNRPTALAMRVSIISLALTVVLGGWMAGQFAGWWSIPFPREALKSVHLTLGLLGWVACLIMGVGFHIIPMFYLACSFPERAAWQSLGLLLITLVVLPVAFLLEIPGMGKVAAAIPAMAGGGLFIVTLVALFRQRKRKIVDTTLRFWQLGLFCLLISFPLLLAGLWLPEEQWDFLFAMLFLVGFAVSITNGMLYKIIPFLIWLHRFSSLVGKVKVPFMAEIAPDAPARKQWWVSVAALAVLSLGIASHLDGVLRLGGMLWLFSSGLLFFNLYKALKMKPPDV